MKKETYIQDYYGAVTLIKSRRNEELTIFIADDDEFYLKVISAQLSINPSFNIYTFSTGEECLEYASLNPDIVILDYHLDGYKPFAKKGDVIKQQFLELCPNSEIFLISTDKKLQFINDLKEVKSKDKILVKSNKTLERIKGSIDKKSFSKKRFFKKIAALFLMINTALLAPINYLIKIQ